MSSQLHTPADLPLYQADIMLGGPQSSSGGDGKKEKNPIIALA